MNIIKLVGCILVTNEQAKQTTLSCFVNCLLVALQLAYRMLLFASDLDARSCHWPLQLTNAP